MRYLAIDYGSKRSGLAVCDAGPKIASPLTVVRGQSKLLIAIAEVIENHRIGALVVGLPLNMDGSEGPQAKLVRRFAEKLKKRFALPVYFQDERLTSFAAAEKLAPANLTNRQTKKRLDAVAAAEILRAFLDAGKAD